VYNSLSEALVLEIYDGGFGNFCAVGDENGLFICVNKNRKDWYPTQDKAFPSEFELKLLEKGNPFAVEFINEIIHVSSL
jgi:hypothetical protein